MEEDQLVTQLQTHVGCCNASGNRCMWVENMSLNINREDVHMPKSCATEQQNNKQVDKTAKNKISQVDLD